MQRSGRICSWKNWCREGRFPETHKDIVASFHRLHNQAASMPVWQAWRSPSWRVGNDHPRYWWRTCLEPCIIQQVNRRILVYQILTSLQGTSIFRLKWYRGSLAQKSHLVFRWLEQFQECCVLGWERRKHTLVHWCKIWVAICCGEEANFAWRR